MGKSLNFPFPDVPGPGAKVEVARGVFWVRMPLPFRLNHINLWLLDDGDGWVIVDCGIASQETKDLWEVLFARELDFKKVKGVVVTHFHPDHFGLAGWLAERWGVEIQMSSTEWKVGQILAHGPSEDSKIRAREYNRGCGFDAEITASTHKSSNYHTSVSALPAEHKRLKEGESLSIGGRSWKIMIGQGHSPEHVCLWCPEDELLIAGDQVLARISPNVSVWPAEPEADPLGQFLSSIEKIHSIVPASTLVLPSHGYPFYGLHERLTQLASHHHERLQQTIAACDPTITVKELLPKLFGKALMADQVPFAIGETLAHLNYLIAQGKLRRSFHEGVWHYAVNKT